MTGRERGDHLTTMELVAIQRADATDAADTTAGNSWTRHVLAIQQGTTVPGAIAITLSLLALSWTVSYAGGAGADAASHHLFWLPIVWAAFRLGLPGAVGTGLAAALLSGPALPAPEPWVAVVVRGGAFIAIGAMAAVAATRLVVLLGREDALAEREHELELQRAALIRAVSHEFRTPLTVIKGAPYLLAQDGIPEDRRQQLLDRLGAAGERLERLVETVLAIGDAIGPRPTNDQRQDIVQTDLEELVTGLAQRYDDGARVRFAAANDARAVRTVPNHLGTVLGNLIENALKFAPDGTPVEVTARRVGDRVEIAVRDEGPGISLAQRRDAFELFTQLDGSTTRQHGGLGVGLFCARQVGRLLAAQVDVGSASTGGTQALVSLPQRRDEDLALAA